jgi:tRNA pseudouridine55 synthase
MISGLLIVNKASGETSHSIVDKIRKLYKIPKVGHFGTLDPMAEGVLLLGLGQATKFFDFYIHKVKHYSGTIKFGYGTSTYDREGLPLSGKIEINLNNIDLDSLLKGFTGDFLQTPPAYSAKKHKGKPLYKYARENKKIEIKPVMVSVHSLKGKILEPDTLWFETETSAGTYIRSLAHDMGEKLGSGAYLSSLKRLGIGEFKISAATNSRDLTDNLSIEDFSRLVIPIEQLLPEFPKVIVTPAGSRAVVNGAALTPKEILKIFPSSSETKFRIFNEEGKLLAIAGKDLKVRRFNPFIVFPE